MANKSAEHPEGLLTGDVFKSFYAMSGDYPNFKYTPGYEAFPKNWYKRNPVDYYTIPYFAVDAVAMATAHPQFAAIGGNTGKVRLPAVRLTYLADSIRTDKYLYWCRPC